MFKISINDNKLNCISIRLNPEDLIFVYSSFVVNRKSMFVGIVPGDGEFYVDIEYIERFDEILQDLDIIPPIALNDDYYKWKKTKKIYLNPTLKDVHTSHCCEEHKVCKYGKEYTECTVCLGIAPAEYPCNCGY